MVHLDSSGTRPNVSASIVIILCIGGDLVTIGETLRSFRLKKKRTLKEQSEALGVSVNSVYRWEHDLALPRKSALKKMAATFGVTIERLLQGNSLDNVDRFSGSIYYDDNTEQQLLSMFRKLSEPDKYRLLGYIERICVEDMDDNKMDSVIPLRQSINVAE